MDDLDDPDRNEVACVAPNGAAGDLPQLLTSAEVAAIFACTERTVRRWIAAGHLAPVRIGRTLRFRADDIRVLLDRDLIGTVLEPARQRDLADPTTRSVGQKKGGMPM